MLTTEGALKVRTQCEKSWADERPLLRYLDLVRNKTVPLHLRGMFALEILPPLKMEPMPRPPLTGR